MAQLADAPRPERGGVHIPLQVRLLLSAPNEMLASRRFVSRDGAIGRRTGSRDRCPLGLAGSNPVRGTPALVAQFWIEHHPAKVARRLLAPMPVRIRPGALSRAGEMGYH